MSSPIFEEYYGKMEDWEKLGFYAAHKKYKDIEIFSALCKMQSENVQLKARQNYWIWEEPNETNNLNSMAKDLKVLIPASKLQEMQLKLETMKMQRDMTVIMKRCREYIPKQYDNSNRCLMCGEQVPEGREVCPICMGETK